MSRRLELLLWCLGAVIISLGLACGAIALHRSFAGQAQQQVRHSLYHQCQENVTLC